jgi:hypothetical protein
MYLVLALSAGETGAGLNRYTFASFLPLALMSPSSAIEVLFGNYRDISPFALNFTAWKQN